MSKVKWPSGYEALYKHLKKYRKTILEGTVLAIDPSSGHSSPPGYAYFKAGQLTKCGIIQVNPKLPWPARLVVIGQQARKLFDTPPDFVAIEMMRGTMSGYSLMFSVGALISAARCRNVSEIPTNFWKALAKTDPNYFKDDVEDSKKIGESVILFCKECEDD